MKKYTRLFFANVCLAGMLFLGGCQDDKTDTGEEVAVSGWSKDYMDPSVKPGDDFYRYALGGWMKSSNGYSTGYIAYEAMEKLAGEVLDDFIAGKDDIGMNVRNQYEILVNEDTRAAGVRHLGEKVKKMLACGSRDELIDQAIVLGRTGYLMFWNTEFDVDLYKVGINLLTLDALTPDMEYDNPALEAAYLRHAEEVLGMLGVEGDEARRVAANALEAERLIAEGGEGDLDGMYFKRYMDDVLDFSGRDSLENDFTGFAYLFDEADPGVLRDYLAWSLVARNEQYLSKEILTSYNVLCEQLTSREWTMNEVARDMLREVYKKEITREVCNRLTRPGLMEACEEMAGEILAVTRERVEQASWIKDANTRKEAMLKLDKMGLYVMGKKMETRGTGGWSSTIEYVASARKGIRERLAAQRGIYVPVDRQLEEFNELDYNTIVLWEYNVVNMLAGKMVEEVLPRLDDPGYLYGFVGQSVGCMMMRSLLGKGSKHDSDGEWRDWWTPADVSSFEKVVRGVSDYYSTLTFEGYEVDGQRVADRGIAELMGTLVAFEAMKRATGDAELRDADGFTAAQRFFFGKAFAYAETKPEESADYFLTSDFLYPPLLVTSVCANMDGWYEAFPEVQPGDKWYIAPENRLKVW